jgi:hypothetical protein
MHLAVINRSAIGGFFDVTLGGYEMQSRLHFG